MNLRVIALVFASGTSTWLSAQPDVWATQDRAQRVPEEVQVIGDRSLLELRTQMMAAEVKAYELFNQFNDEKRFHISCSMHQPVGTRIPRQVCHAAFELDATAAHGRDYLESLRDVTGFGGVPNSSPRQHAPVEAVIARQLPQYRRKIRKVAEEHPEFLDAIISFTEARQRYEAAISTAPAAD